MKSIFLEKYSSDKSLFDIPADQLHRVISFHHHRRNILPYFCHFLDIARNLLLLCDF